LHCRKPVGKYFITKNDLIIDTIYIEKDKVKEIHPIDSMTSIELKISERQQIIDNLMENRRYILNMFEFIAEKS
jgi:hypothetical protein